MLYKDVNCFLKNKKSANRRLTKEFYFWLVDSKAGKFQVFEAFDSH